MPKSSLQIRTMLSTAMPAVFFSGSSGRSDDVPVIAAMRTPALRRCARGHAIADRLEAVAEHVEADGDVADAGGRKCRCSPLRHGHSFAPK